MYIEQGHFEDTRQEAELKQAWYRDRVLLDICQDQPDDVVGFIKECDAADLHQFSTVQGIKEEVPLFLAILSHPKCDRATALNIFAACDPLYFDKKIETGENLSQLDEEDEAVFWQILMSAYRCLRARESWRGRFVINAEQGWIARPETHPCNLKHLKLSPATLRPAQNQDANSAIIHEYTTIALSFDAWMKRH